MSSSKLPATERVVKITANPISYWVIPSQKGDFYLMDDLMPQMFQKDAAVTTYSGGFRTRDVPTYFALFEAMYNLRNDGSEAASVREFVQAALRSNFLSSLTRINYSPKNDCIIHNFGHSSRKRTFINFKGMPGDIGRSLSLEQSLTLTGKTPAEVVEILSYLNNTTSVMLCREGASNPIASIAGFSAGSGAISLYCSRQSSFKDSSLGVFIKEN